MNLKLFFLTTILLSGFSWADTPMQDHKSIHEAVSAFAGEKVKVQAIDERLRLERCDRPLSVRYPFSSTTTVEVRCPDQGGWKIYLPVTPASPAAPQPTAKKSRQTARPNTVTKLPGVVSTGTLQRGMPIRRGDLEIKMFTANRLKKGHFSKIKDLLGMEPTQAIPKGALLSNNMVRPPVLVRKGEPVTIMIERNGIRVSNKGEALEDGGLREKIRVLLPYSNKVISAVVYAVGVVKIP